MRTREELSPEWKQIGELVCESTLSYREIGRRFNFSDTAVRKAAAKHNWRRPDGGSQKKREPKPREPQQKVFAAPRADTQPAYEPPITGPSPELKDLADASETELNRLGRNIVLEMMSELRFLNRNVEILSEFVESRLSGEEFAGERRVIDRLLNFETRTKAMSNLSTALSKMAASAPGKKEIQKTEAERIAAGGDDDWGDDLATPAGKFN